MTVTFHGIDHTTLEATPYGSFPLRVYLNDNYDADFNDPRNLNLSSVNARAFLAFLDLDSGDDLCGDLPLPTVRRAIIRARATFERLHPHPRGHLRRS